VHHKACVHDDDDDDGDDEDGDDENDDDDDLVLGCSSDRKIGYEKAVRSV